MKVKIQDKNEKILFNEDIPRGTIRLTLWGKSVFIIAIRGHYLFFEALNTDEGTISTQYRFTMVGKKAWREHVYGR